MRITYNGGSLIEGTGYGNVTVNFVRELARRGHDMVVSRGPALIFDWPGTDRAGDVLFTMWEADRLPGPVVHKLNNSGRKLIIVPCEHNLKAFKASGVKPRMAVCPLGADGQFSLLPPGPFTFGYIGRNHGIPARKRALDVVRAFTIAFFGVPNVAMLMKQHTDCDTIHNFDSRITIYRAEWSSAEVTAMIHRCHVGIFPSGLESWNLPANEFMAAGRPVIIPHHNGPADFCTLANSYTLDYKMSKTPTPTYKGVGKYANVSLKSIVDQMRLAYSDTRLLAAKALAARATADNFTWARAATKLERLICS